MNRTQLGQLKTLKLEVKGLQEELSTFPIGDTYVADTIKDYSSGYPRVQIIRGYGMSESAYKKQQQLYKRLVKKNEEIQDLIAEMEEWLDTIPDSETRLILRLTYRNGLTQEKIAEELGCSDRTVKRKIKTFWGNVL